MTRTGFPPSPAEPLGAVTIDGNVYGAVANNQASASGNAVALAAALAAACSQAQLTGASSAIVELQSGVYYINGPLITTGGVYALVPIPILNNNGTNTMMILTVRAKGKPGSVTNVSGSLNATGPLVFQSLFTGGTYSGTYGWPSIFGAADAIQMPSFSYNSVYLSWMHLVFEGCIFRQPANPSLCAVNASLIGQASFRGCRWDTTDNSNSVTDYPTQPTNPTGCAYFPPNDNTSQGCIMEGTNWVVGHYGGFGVGEVFRNSGTMLAYECIVGFNLIGPINHVADVGYASPVNCVYDFAQVGSTGFGPILTKAGAQFAIVGQVDNQDGPNPGGVSWTTKVAHIYDPANALVGTLSYLRVKAGFGTLNGLVNTGARRLVVKPWQQQWTTLNGQGATIVVADSVHRANNASSPGSPEYGGTAWTVLGPGTWGVSGAALYVASGVGASQAGVIYTNAGVANCTVGYRPTQSGTTNLAVRVQDANNFILISGANGAIYSYIAGTLTLVTAGTISYTPNQSVVCVMNGNTITSYVNEQLSATATIANFNTQTNHGLCNYGASGQTGCDFFVSNP